MQQGIEIIDRELYLEKITPYINQNLIKIFVGQRRVGKSYILKSTIRKITNQYKDANIIFIDKEQYDFDRITNYHELNNYVENKIDSNKKNFLFIDEIQEIEGFQKSIRHFHNKNTVDIYITGSNAQMLSGELATSLSGRYIKIKVNNLSYTEFLEFHQLADNDESLNNYLKWGGLPYLKNLIKNDLVIFEYLNNIVSTVLYKDIISRYNIRNTDFFHELILYTAANTGNLITSKKISDYLKSQRVDISPRVILNYLHYLTNAFMLYKISREDVQSKKIFEINHKYYFEDWGMRNALLGQNNYSAPDILENVVFSHLKNQGYAVSVGVLKNLEIDFIARRNNETIYIQVAYLIIDEKTRNREFGNLLQIKDNYPKYVISLDPVQIGQYEGVKHLHLRDFLKRTLFE